MVAGENRTKTSKLDEARASVSLITISTDPLSKELVAGFEVGRLNATL